MSRFPSKYADNSEQSIGFSFIRVYNIWHRAIKTDLAEIGLTHPQFVVLASLGHLSQNDQEATQVVIAETSDIDVMTASTIIKNLEKKELIKRTPSVNDSRAKKVELTPDGLAIMQQALKIVEEIDLQFFGKLAEDRESFNRMLHRLAEE